MWYIFDMRKLIHHTLFALICISTSLILSACSVTDIDTKFNTSALSLDPEVFNAAVFYYDYEDTYISSVRSKLNKLLVNAGMNYNEFDANSSQATQNSQIESAISAGVDLLIVNIVDSGSVNSSDIICLRARRAGIPVIFFNRPIEGVGDEGVILKYYDSIAFIGSDPEESGHLQGQMIGEYLVNNFDSCDLNGDGHISYALMKGEAKNSEAIYRTKYSVEDANTILNDNGYPELVYFDEDSVDKFQLDLTGKWSLNAGQDYMMSDLGHYNDANDNMIELVICNNDSMAEGCIRSLQTVGYNLPENKNKNIPVFGVDATASARKLISEGSMTGTIVQDPDEMANCILLIAQNIQNSVDLLSPAPKSTPMTQRMALIIPSIYHAGFMIISSHSSYANTLLLINHSNSVCQQYKPLAQEKH